MTKTPKLAVAARLLLGLVFLLFGLNGLLDFMPVPPMPAAGAMFLDSLAATGYLGPLLATTEVAAGALLLAGVFVPLALVLLAPILINITAFHIFLAPGNFAIVGLVLASELYLVWQHRAVFAPLLSRGTVGAADSMSGVGSRSVSSAH
jgi:uncharacterized membrane protein YphA (DoxX/SURF4 family)